MASPRKAPLLILALAALAALAWYAVGRGDDEAASQLLFGNVDIREVDLAFRVAGRVSELTSEEGDRVAAGDVLARLDDGPLADAVAVARAAVAQAEANAAKLRAGPRPQEIRQAEAQVEVAAADAANGRRELARQEEMIADGATSQRELDQAATRLRAAKARLAAAREALALLREGFRSEDIAAAEAALAVARAQLQQAETRLADATLSAPDGGTILTRVREAGSIVQAGQPVYTLSLDRPVRIRAYVDEPRLGQVVPGMEVTVTTDSSERAYRGQVGFVSPRAEFTPKSVETEDLRTDLVYRLRIVIADPDDGLRQGMPVTVHLPDRPAAAGTAP